MSFLFWLALVVGGGLFLLSLAGDVFGLDSHHDIPVHSDVHGGETDWGRIFSLRNATYFLFAFGAVGVSLNFLWAGERPTITVLAAAFTGAVAWALSAAAFEYIRRNESGAMPGDRALVGRIGQVVLPIRREAHGKIMITKGAQTQELLARPLDESEANPETWSSVIVVEIRDGVALVAPFTEAQLEAPTKE